MQLQLRSAVSHLNEVWAVETGGAILQAFGDQLGWEFIFDAARWTYDESRHTRMGYERLKTWGYQPQEIPLGSYIYDSARGQDPLSGWACSTISKPKTSAKRPNGLRPLPPTTTAQPARHGLRLGRRDDPRRLRPPLAGRAAWRAAGPVPDIDTIRQQCDSLVAAEVATATPADRSEIFAVGHRPCSRPKEKK